jgi:hypothetical protein
MESEKQPKSMEEQLAELKQGQVVLEKGQAELKTEVGHLQGDARRQRIILKKLPGICLASLFYAFQPSFINQPAHYEKG